jgi:Glycosyltransferase family 87
MQLRKIAPLVAASAAIPLAASVAYTFDFGLAYHGGVEAWATGHPERLTTWFSTPFLGLVMALVTRVTTESTGAVEFTVLNLSIWAALLTVTWNRLYELLPIRVWWLTLAAAAVFAPAISNIFWLQFNLLVFALALAGFALIGRSNGWSGVLIGLSVALKPILILLPLALLARRWSRRSGWWALATGAVATTVGLAFLAWRAGDARLLNPASYLSSFVDKGGGPLAGCVIENYSPIAFLCRLGVAPSTPLTVAVGLGVVALGWWIVRRLGDAPAARWELFAGACLLSPLIGPVAWSSYGLLMMPLLLLLCYQLWREKGPVRLWIGVAAVYLMADLVWDPIESLVGVPVAVLVFSYAVGQFSQYILLLVWLRWQQLRLQSQPPDAAPEQAPAKEAAPVLGA